MLIKCVRQLVARASDQLKRLSSFAHCVHSTLMIYAILCCFVMYWNCFCSKLLNLSNSYKMLLVEWYSVIYTEKDN